MPKWTEEQKLAMRRKVSATVARYCANRSQEFEDKISIKKSVSKWNKKVDQREKSSVWLRKRLQKIIPREKNYCGVQCED
jgi:hypothetical protein